LDSVQQHVIGSGNGLGCCGTKYASKEVKEEEENGETTKKDVS
jgi:hypothetical protein